MSRQVATNIAHNPVQHDRRKHVEIDRHFIKEKLKGGLNCSLFVPSENQLVDMLTKRLVSELRGTSMQAGNEIHSLTSLRESVRNP